VRRTGKAENGFLAEDMGFFFQKLYLLFIQIIDNDFLSLLNRQFNNL
jgi:hypothetical protein